MIPESQIITLQQVAKRLPLNSEVWHRADGRLGIVKGYCIQVQGLVEVRLDYGGAGWDCEEPGSLTTKKPVTHEDGEEWKRA